MESPDGRYAVVVNAEAQYSIWPSSRALPPGWTRVEFPNEDESKEACLAYIEEQWTDMRPMSLRRVMDGSAGR